MHGGCVSQKGIYYFPAQCLLCLVSKCMIQSESLVGTLHADYTVSWPAQVAALGRFGRVGNESVNRAPPHRTSIVPSVQCPVSSA